MENLTNFLNYYPQGAVITIVLSSFLLATLVAWGIHELISSAHKEYEAIKDGFLKLESFNLRTRTGLELAQKTFSEMPFKIKKGVNKKWYKKYDAHFIPYFKIMNEYIIKLERLKKYTWLASMEDDLKKEEIKASKSIEKEVVKSTKSILGRPKGSKSKPKSKIGRPKGSKSKPKSKVGRPKGSKSKQKK